MIKSWMIIGIVTIAVAFAGNIFRPDDVRWFRRLRRPKWLTFEALIPVIWSIVFIGGAWSAYLVWEANPGATQIWWLMAFYLLLEITIVAYSPITLRFHNLKAGTVIGAIGFVLGCALTVLVFPISALAALLLLPYLVLSPIGTYTTWVMDKLN